MPRGKLCITPLQGILKMNLSPKGLSKGEIYEEMLN
jgi:hypothetical protein